jgi:hypothetical protein
VRYRVAEAFELGGTLLDARLELGPVSLLAPQQRRLPDRDGELRRDFARDLDLLVREAGCRTTEADRPEELAARTTM